MAKGAAILAKSWSNCWEEQKTDRQKGGWGHSCYDKKGSEIKARNF